MSIERYKQPGEFFKSVVMAGLLGLSCAGDIDAGSETPPGDGVGEIPGMMGAVGSPKGPPNAAMPQGPTNPPGTVPPPIVTPERAQSQVCRAVEPGPQVIRRLTRLEYNNTVRELLGVQSAPASAFPAENVVHSFDNDAMSLTASPVLTEGYLEAAERMATEAVENKLVAVLGCDPAMIGEDVCAAKFFDSFGKRAYRRPLTADDRAILMDMYGQGKKSSGFKGGIRVSLATMLASVHFLYRVEFGAAPQAGQTVTSLTPWELASRLSYLIWRSMPDAALLAAAETNKLGTREDIDAQVTRMMADPKARDTVADFHEQWLHLRGIEAVEKDLKVYPAFRSGTAALMKQETLKFVENVVWEGEGTLSQLYTAPFTFANATLGKYYGLSAALGTTFQKVPLENTPARVGFLTQGALMTVLAQENQTHPVRRGAFVRTDLLCQSLPAPPNDLKIEFPPVSKTLTGRERFVQHRVDPACSGCHALIDPIGFGLEAFDGVGQYRQTENGKTLDLSGDVVGLKGGGKFNGAAELGAVLAKSEEASDCVVLAWFRYAYGRDAEAADACSLDLLKRAFASSKFKVKDLIVALAKTDAFQFRRVIAPGGAQ